jgi:hypothetical protein
MLLAGCGSSSATSRQDQVAARGAEVMAFDLDRTTHRFEPVDDGLVQSVVADDPADATQVELIRAHLAHEAERFARGDFGDPAAIHGTDMPGLAALERAEGAVTVDYVEQPAGAGLRFTTADPLLVDALHAWARAQVADHGDHAEHVDHDQRGG